MMIRSAVAMGLSLACILAQAAEPRADVDYAQEFVRVNQSRYEEYLSKLKAAWETCCGDQERRYETVAGASCRRGDMFLGGPRRWDASEQKKPPVEGGLRQLFEVDVRRYTVCDIPNPKGGCLRSSPRWDIYTFAKGMLGAAAVTVDDGRCILSVNDVKLSTAGYGAIEARELSPKERVQSIVGAPEPLTVRATIIGPSDMSALIPHWKAGGIPIQGEQGFRRDGRLWITEAKLVVLRPPVEVTFEIRRPGDDSVAYVGTTRVTGHAPPLDGLQFKRAGHDILLGETLDLFYPNDDPMASILESQARLVNGQIVPNWAAPGIEDPKFALADASVARLDPFNVASGVHRLYPRHHGKTELRIDYPENLQMARAQAFSEVYPVQVHELTLAKVIGAAGAERYRLVARGPGPGRNHVRWGGPNAGVASFVKEGAFWIAETPAAGVSRLNIVNPDGQTIAFLDTSRSAPLDAAAIRLLPPAKPNFTVFNTMPMPSTDVDMAGWAVSSGFCSQVSAGRLPQAMTRGTNAGALNNLLAQARYLCQNKEQLRKNQEQIRRIVPEINRLTRELARGGRELVGLEDDSVAVGAAIKGLSAEFADRAYCRWSLKDAGASRLAFNYTPAERVGQSAGACFNRVTNLIEGFQPGMRVAVELIVEL